MATEYTESHDLFLKDALPDLPGVVRSDALRQLRLAMREFFERSYAWVVTVEDVSIPTGDTAIQFDDGDDNTEVISVLGVKIGTDADGYEPMTPLLQEPDLIEGSENPSSWYITSNPDEIKLHPYQESSTTSVLRARVALIPAFDTDNTANELPRQVALKYYDAILNGFLARMLARKNKPYTDQVRAQQLRHNFNRQIGFYASQRKKGYNNSPAWSYPRGWSPRLRGGRSRVG